MTQMFSVPEIYENELRHHPPSALEDQMKLLDGGSDVPTDELVDAVQVEEVDIDAILAKGLNQLSMEERNQVFHDLHGVSEVFPEDPEVVQDKLDQLEHCLQQIPDKDAYEHALYLSQDYVRNVKFRKMFLRSHGFSPQAAAECMVQHFQIKRDLFGPERLARDLYLTDLDEEDMAALQTGFQQRLAIRDRADRTVFCILPMLLGNQSHRARNKAYWYTVMKELQDEETQKNGAIILVWNTGPNRKGFEEAGFVKSSLAQRGGLPMKSNAYHFMYDHSLVLPIATLFTLFLKSSLRTRFRHHYFVKHSDHVYNLQTFGIPTQVLPLDNNGAPLLEYHMDWIQRCRMQEEAAAASARGGTTNQRSNTVLIPRRFDVLFGRGMAAAEHTGNLRAFHIVEMNRGLYEKASKHEKTYLAQKIVKLINTSYGRFLKMNKATGVWQEVESDLAREKISHYFRRLRELDSVAEHNGKTTVSSTKRPGASSSGGSSEKDFSSNDAAAESSTDSGAPGKRFRRPSS